jgi:hypothetical protein
VFFIIVSVLFACECNRDSLSTFESRLWNIEAKHNQVVKCQCLSKDGLSEYKRATKRELKAIHCDSLASRIDSLRKLINKL